MSDPRPSLLERVALAFTRFSERFIPDAFVFALLATAIVFVAALAIGAAPLAIVDAWGGGFWDLAAFTTQMAVVIVAGYVLASSPPVYRGIGRLAALPSGPRSAVALVTAVAMTTAWVNWGFSLIVSAVLAKEVARRVPRADYRALGAASFLGLGSVWAQGLSGSAALQTASAETLPEAIRAVIAGGGAIEGGIIPLRHTIFLWQSQLAVAVELALVIPLMALLAPTGERARSAADLGIDLGPPLDQPAPAEPPARSVTDALERSPLLTVVVVALGAAWIGHTLGAAASPLGAVTLNTVNLAMLSAGFALHRTPARLQRAVRDATPSVWGVILQFPFYAGIAGIITATHLSERIAHLFTRVSTPASYPAVIALYSAALGVLVPSGGSKWVIEAPYVMRSAHDLHVHLGWMVACYDLGEALANLVQPFWMLPILALLKLRARDVMGYTFVVFLLLLPTVLLLVTLLGRTLHYPL